MRLMIFYHVTDNPCVIQLDDGRFMNAVAYPDNLVQYVARDLLRRASIITVPITRVREISSAPLPLSELRELYPKTPLEQWQMVTHAPQSDKPSLWRKLNPFAGEGAPKAVAWRELAAHCAESAPASLVLAPLVLDRLAEGDVLNELTQLPSWFEADGVLLFATLGAGAWPELVNRDEAWLEWVRHLPTIMDMGRRLQDLRFGLPVLDIETVRLGYTDSDTLWHDVLAVSAGLRALSPEAQAPWRDRLETAFQKGLRELSLDVIYGQVWQPSVAPTDTGVRTVSLESLTASLKNRSEGQP